MNTPDKPKDRYYGLHCLRCDTMQFWFKNNQELVNTCLRMWVHVKELQAIMKREWPGVFTEVTVSYGDHRSEIWMFLREHDGHAFVITDDQAVKYPLDVSQEGDFLL